MGNILGTKSRLVCGHISGIVLFAIIMVVYGYNKFIGDGDNVPVKDNGCVLHGGLNGASDITPVGPNSALIGNADRENWLLHDIIENEGKEMGKISLFKSDSQPGDTLPNLLTSSGFPIDTVDFNPHGMALTPNWVSTTEKQLFVVNHAWNRGGERIEVFDVTLDSDGNAESLTWRYAMGDLAEGQADGVPVAIKDSKFQQANYGQFNGLAVSGKDEVLVARWFGPYEFLPGEEGYTS